MSLTCSNRRYRTPLGRPSGDGIDKMPSRMISDGVAGALSSWNGPESVAITVGQSSTDTQLLVWDTFQESRKPDWDGYGAIPVTREVFERAIALVRSFPTTLPMPDVAAEPGGEIGFEWRMGNATIALTVDKRSRLKYAVVNGRDTEYGSTDFVELLPLRLVELIAAVTR